MRWRLTKTCSFSSTANSSFCGLPEAPVFIPTNEEFADPIAYITKIRPIAEKAGICRIVPPSDWDKDAFFKNIDINKFQFTTKCQSVHQLMKGVDNPNNNFLKKLRQFLKDVRHINLRQLPQLEKQPIDLFRYYNIIDSLGGLPAVNDKRWTDILQQLKIVNTHTSRAKLIASMARCYNKYLQPFAEYYRNGPGQESLHSSLGSEKSTSKDDSDDEASVELISETRRLPVTKTAAAAGALSETESDPDDEIQVLSERKLPTPVTEVKVQPAPKDEDEDDDEMDDSEDTPTKEDEPRNPSLNVNQRSRRPVKRNTKYDENAASFSDSDDECRPESVESSEDDEVQLTPTRKRKREKQTPTPKSPSSSSATSERSLRSSSPSSSSSSSPGESSSKKQRKLLTWKDVRMRYFVTEQAEEDITCAVCGKGDDAENLVICDGNCMSGCHTYCMSPKMSKIPEDDWYCDDCEKEDGEPEDLGYDEGQDYTFNTFRGMADLFQSKWMGQNTSPFDIEAEYWRLVESGDEQCVVHYGSDLDVAKHCSGFPLNRSRICPETSRWRAPNKMAILRPQKANTEYMVNSGWNLNNLPYVSVLRYLGQSIPGVTRPMLYVGMLFSTFCWHTEDNFLYSINYVHHGASKRWYGVPAQSADAFEQAMKAEVPQLFNLQPNLLYLLVTMLSPDRLKKYNVPVYTTVQNEGEFMITFPRGYHAGFNNGFNVAESVNFAAPDWFTWGRLAIDTYRSQRPTVFGLDEILCKCALASSRLVDSAFASHLLKEFKTSVDLQLRLFKKLQRQGVYKTVNLPAQARKEDCRQCDHCGFDCYFFGVTCDCNRALVTCLEHSDHLCSCDDTKKKIICRYSADQLRLLLETTKESCEKLIIAQ